MADMPGEGESNRHELVGYLESLEKTILTEAFDARISAREKAGEFPFDIHNIYRVLFRVAGPMYRQLGQVGGLSATDRELGTSLRCFRYLHVYLLGAFADGPPDADAAISMLGPMARRANRLHGLPDCFCADPSASGRIGTPIAAGVAVRLAVVLRQFADVRWLGQHDQGFIGMRPSGSLYVRCFGRLPAQSGHDRLSVVTAYANVTDIEYDAFRGEVTNPPPPGAIARSGVYSASARRWLDEPETKVVLTAVTSALVGAKADAGAEFGTGDAGVARLFCSELLALVERAGLEPDDSLVNAISSLERTTDVSQRAAYTSAYLRRLGEVVTEWKRLLDCGG
jgi:hypothetical protein